MRIRKSECVESDETYYYIGKFNTALSLCGVLRVTLYFSKGFLKVVATVLQPLGMTIVCFLEQESNLWSSTPQQRCRLCSSHFLCLLLVNLPLLASLEERFIHREFSYFFGAGDEDGLEKDNLVNEAARDIFVLFWKTAELPAVEAFPCFWE